MSITLLNYTEFPLQHIGKIAGICWNSADTPEKNIARAKDCIISEHGRAMEYVDMELVIETTSARCIRELYTHIIGTSRLQESTRYVNMSDFGFYTPPEISNNIAANTAYTDGITAIKNAYSFMVDNGIKKENAANILPIGMDTKIVWKVNLRALVHFMNLRLCSRALLEIRELAKEIRSMLHDLNAEWAWIADNLLVPKCEVDKFRNPLVCLCREKQCCGRHPSINDIVVVSKERYDAMSNGEI